MTQELTFSQFVSDYLNEYLSEGALKEFSVFVCREDGQLLYNRDYMNMGVESSSIGALLGGVWQAATTLASFIPQESSDGVYRLSFDTTDQGIYILPFSHNEESYSLGLLYKNEMNPGFVKSRLRDLLMKMNLELDSLNFEPVKTRSGYLFDNITDEEMDKVFNLNGGDRCHS